MITKDFNIEGMSCDHCVRAVIKELSELDLDYYEVDIGVANIKYDENRISENQIVDAINDDGYKVTKK